MLCHHNKILLNCDTKYHISNKYCTGPVLHLIAFFVKLCSYSTALCCSAGIAISAQATAVWYCCKVQLILSWALQYIALSCSRKWYIGNETACSEVWMKFKSVSTNTQLVCCILLRVKHFFEYFMNFFRFLQSNLDTNNKKNHLWILLSSLLYVKL